MDENFKNNLLGLQLPTDPRWVDIAKMNIEEILVDHAYCEQKAASSCISLIILYPADDRTGRNAYASGGRRVESF